MQTIRGNRLPAAYSYAAARNLFERLEPFDKDDPDTRMLVTKREWEKRVEKRGDSYRFIFHSTSVVIWDSDIQVRLTPWSSMSTGIFAGRFLPHDIDFRAGRSTPLLTLNRTELYVPLQQLRMVRRPDGGWAIHPDDLECVKKSYRYDITDRKAASAAREKVKNYLAWVKVARKDKYFTPSGLSDSVRLAEELVGGGEDYGRYFERVGVPPQLDVAALIAAGAVKKTPAPLGLITTSRFDDFSSYLD